MISFFAELPGQLADALTEEPMLIVIAGAVLLSAARSVWWLMRRAHR